MSDLEIDNDELNLEDLGSGSEEEQPQQERRKRLKKKRLADLELDEEDLDLIQENVGVVSHQADYYSDEEAPQEDYYSDEEDSHQGRKQAARKTKSRKVERDVKSTIENSLFGAKSDDKGPSISTEVSRYEQDSEDDSDEDSADDMRDFIVDIDEYGNERQIPKRKKKSKKRQGGISGYKLREAERIFGDEEYSEIFYQGDYDEEHDEYDSKTKSKTEIFQETYGEEAVKSKFLTETDDKIRETDLPENLQLSWIELGRSQPEKSEIAEEAVWIYEQVWGSVSEQNNEQPLVIKPRMTTIPKIKTILEMMLLKHYEVSYIHKYKRDIYSPEFDSVSELWKIWDYDEKWVKLCKKKQQVLKVLGKIFLNEDDLLQDEDSRERNPKYELLREKLENSATETQVSDLMDWIIMEHREDLEKKRELSGAAKRARPKDLYKICLTSGLEKLAKSFSISAEQLGENIDKDSSVYEPEDPSETPDESAVNYSSLDPHFKSISDILKGARLVLAVQISNEPYFRAALRIFFKNNFSFSTTPTITGRSLGLWHPYTVVSQLEGKPARAFSEDRYLVMLKAEKEGFIKISSELDQTALAQDFLQPLEKFYLSDGQSDIANLWNEQRKLVLLTAIQRLTPLLEKEIKTELFEASQNYVIERCVSWTSDRALQGPYRPPDSESFNQTPQEITVMAVVPSQNPAEPTYFALLDEDGRLKDWMKCVVTYFGPRHNQNNFASDNSFQDQNTNQKDSNEQIKRFIETHEPLGIAIPARAEGKRLMSKIDTICQTIADTNSTEKIHLTFVDHDIPYMFSISDRAQHEFEGYPARLLEAISLGRLLQNPLLELTYLGLGGKEILNTKWHPHQDMVNQSTLLKRITRILGSCVATVGADINRAVGQVWASGAIRFIPGLGPRKAKQLIETIQRLPSSSITNREELQEPYGTLGACVYENCAGFIRISKKYINEDYSEGGEWTPLDDSRIHPSDYPLVEKAALDVLQNDQDLIETVFENPQVLSGVDWDGFNEALMEKGSTSKKNILELIREEVNAPFKDPRELYKDPSHQLVWKLMVGEDEESLLGQLVSARVVLIKEDKVLCRLENGIEGVIQKVDISDNAVHSIPMEIDIQKGQTLLCRVKAIDMEHFGFNLVCKSSELQTQKWDDVQTKQLSQLEPYLVLTKPKVLPKKKKKQPMKRKRVEHPLFKDLKFKEAEDYLSKRPSGDLIIRPSSKSPTTLIFSVKLYENVYEHISVTEQMVTGSTRKKYVLGEDEQFEDIDELISTFIEPKFQNFQELCKFRYFKKGTKEEVDKMCLEAKQSDPKRIPYFLSVSYQYPGKFLLSYIPGSKTVQHEYINITPDGYRYRKQHFNHPERLIKWFKVHYKDAPPQSAQPKKPLIATLPSESEFSGGFTESHSFNNPPASGAKSPWQGWGSSQPTASTSQSWKPSTPAAPSQPKTSLQGWENVSSGSQWSNNTAQQSTGNRSPWQGWDEPQNNNTSQQRPPQQQNRPTTPNRSPWQGWDEPENNNTSQQRPPQQQPPQQQNKPTTPSRSPWQGWDEPENNNTSQQRPPQQQNRPTTPSRSPWQGWDEPENNNTSQQRLPQQQQNKPTTPNRSPWQGWDEPENNNTSQQRPPQQDQKKKTDTDSKSPWQGWDDADN